MLQVSTVFSVHVATCWIYGWFKTLAQHLGGCQGHSEHKNVNNFVPPHLPLFWSDDIFIPTSLCNNRSRGSSVSIVSDYGLDDRVIRVRFPAEAKDFSSSLCVQTSSEAHPASCPMGTGGAFPGGKAWLGRDADHSPHLVPRSWMSRSYTSSPPKRFHGV
jgi:hypothetical protein